MTKQAETSKNSEQNQKEEQIKSRNLLDKETNSEDNVLDFIHANKYEQAFQKVLKNSTGFLKTEASSFSSNSSYKRDYSTTSSPVSNCGQVGKHKESAEFNFNENNQADFSSDRSSNNSDQESSLNISLPSSINSQFLESSSHLGQFSTSVTNITDFSQSTFMDSLSDKITISKKTYLRPNANFKLCEDGWVMKETIIRPLKKYGLEKGNSCRQKSKSRQQKSYSNLCALDFDNKFKNSIYPITLRYYLHLYNEKQKKIDKNKNIPLLYNKTVSSSMTSKSSSNESSNDSVNISPQNSILNEENTSISNNSSYNFEMIDREIFEAFISNKKNLKHNKNSKSTDYLECELTQIIDGIMSKKDRSKSEYRRDECQKNRNRSPSRSRSKCIKKFPNRMSKSYDQKFSSQNSIHTEFSDPHHSKDTSKTAKEVKFSIDTKNSGGGLVTAEIKLNNKMVIFDLKKINETKYELKLIPKQVGEYKIYMFLNNQSVKGSPFSIKIDSLNGAEITQNLSFNKIKNQRLSESNSRLSGVDNISQHQRKSNYSTNYISKIDVFELSNKNEDLIVGEEVKLNVRIIDYGQYSKSLNSTIDAKVTHNEKLVEHKLELPSTGIYQIKFLPIETGIYDVFFYKNGNKIEGCPYKLHVKGRFLREISKPSYAQVGNPFTLNVEYCNVTNLKAIVYSEKEPLSSMSEKCTKSIAKLVNLPVEKIIQSDSRLRLNFVPLHASEHLIDLIENGISIEGFPIKVNVFPNNEIFMVTENTNGVQVGSLAKFRIYLNGIKDSLNIKITNIDSGNCQFATFLLDQEYQLSNHIFAALAKFLKIDQNRIKNRDVTIENGYTRVIFTIEEEKNFSNNSVLNILKQIIENEKFIIIDLSLNKTIKAITNSFKFGAKGENVGFKLTKQINKSFDYLGEFKPSSVGRYRIDIENFNAPIRNSPFFINAFDPNLVKIVKIPSSVNVGDENVIEIDRSLIGFSELHTEIESPTGIKLPFKIDHSFNHKVRFIAREKGIHRFCIKLGDNPIRDHTFEINATETCFLKAYGNGLYNGLENTYSVFYAQISDSIDGKVEVDIFEPNGTLIKNYISKIDEFLYEVKYIPHKIGKFRICIKLDGKEIPSSPFTANVINPDKVRIKDDCQYFFNAKNIDLELGQEKLLCFNTFDAGEGDIRLNILAPDNQLLPYSKKNFSLHHQQISFCPVSEGEYKINIYFNNYELKYSPICIKTTNFLDTSLAKIYGDGAKKAFLFKESNFFIDLSNMDLSNKNLDLSVTAISTEFHELKFEVKKIQDKIYNCTFVPDKTGQYLLSIKLNNIFICGSPFILNIEMNTDPKKIQINKNDFKNVIMEETMSTIIDTRSAGNGELSASCLGLTKSAECQFTDRKDGTYELKIRPVETGKHFLCLKYNDINVSNSPFIFKVSSPPDASKVQVFGPGINHGVIDEFKSNFICDTRGAGAGQLTVRIRGPKGAFRVDMKRNDERDRRIECSYDPLESGEYEINVKWSGRHVPKSPFIVQIFKTKQELENFLSEFVQDKSLGYLENDMLSC